MQCVVLRLQGLCSSCAWGGLKRGFDIFFGLLVTLGMLHKRVSLHYGSNVAATNIQGLWRSRCNLAMTMGAVGWYLFRSLRNRVHWSKVAAHTGIDGNGAADALSKMGASGIEKRWGPWDAKEVDSIAQTTPTKRIRLQTCLTSMY